MAADKDILYEQLLRNKKNPTFKLIKDTLESHGLGLKQNSGAATHYTISCPVSDFFSSTDNRTIVKHGKNVIPPYGKRALIFIERMRENEYK